MINQSVVLFVVFGLFYLVDSHPNTPKFSKYEKIVIDLDAGADDAFGLNIVLKNEKYFRGPPLIAITCVAGNTNLENVKNNVMRSLSQFKREDIPVYPGASISILPEQTPSDNFYGDDGFGDFYFDPTTLKKTRLENAVSALIRLATSNPGQITLIALGPLTNIALAIKLDPTFMSKLRKLVICGGAVYGVGNVKPGIEFNFQMDPEAVSIVLSETSYKNTVLVPWDTVVKANISKDWRLDVFGKIDSPDVQFLNNAEKKSFEKSPYWHNADSLVAAVAVWPVATTTIPLRVTPVLCGEARGGLLVDHYRASINATSSNVNVVTEVDAQVFQDTLYLISTY